VFDGQFENEVRLASTRAEVRDAVADVYRRLQQQIDQRKPICVASGKCCHFDEYGHRLYVTTMEMAAFVYQLGEGASGPLSHVPMGERRGEGDSVRLTVIDNPNHPHPNPLPWVHGRGDQAGCPFQIGKLCGVHAIRPFGCRIFFCDATATQWQHDQYEAFHAELKMLHAKLNVPYFYVEWRNALKQTLPAQSASSP
jgi:Fe-S-cluster containining protein